MKRKIRQIHLFLGLLSGAIVLISALTGSILLFRDNIQQHTRHDYMYVSPPEGQQPLPLWQLYHSVQQRNHNHLPLAWIIVPLDKHRAYEFHYIERDRHALTYYDEYKINQTTYVNPYDGTIIKQIDEKKDWLFIVFRMHFALLLGSNIGSWVVGINTCMFILAVLAGLCLWLPKRIGGLPRRLKGDLTGIRNKRMGAWHGLIGLSISVFLLIIGLTGICFAFDAIPDTISRLAPSEPQIVTADVPPSAPLLSQEQRWNGLHQAITARYPHADYYRVNPKEVNDTTDPIKIRLYERANSAYSRHQLVFDGSRGLLLTDDCASNMSFIGKCFHAKYDLHTGAFWGIFSKLLYLLVCLLCATLSITGYLMFFKKNRQA